MASLAQQQRRLVEQHRRAQIANRASFLREFLAAWGLLRTDDLDRAYPAWLRIVMRLIRAFRQTSADLALQHYREMRRLGVPDPEIGMPEVDFDLGNVVERAVRSRRTHPEASVPARVVREARELRRSDRPARITIHWDRADRAAERALRVTGPANIKYRIGRGEAPEKAARNALVDASGSASRHVMNGGRGTTLTLVDNDPVALGWIRVTDGDPCYFCAMLASRGITWGRYARDSFSKKNSEFKGRDFEAEYDNDPRIIGRGQVKVHDHCACAIVEVFSPKDPYLAQANQYRDLWNQYIRGRYSSDVGPGRQSDAVKAWRRLHERSELFKEKLGEHRRAA
jgi:hypothetical protein